jgi:hypothetical protein
MRSALDTWELVNHGIALLGVIASAACLLARIIYRRVSAAMVLLILAFAGDVVVMFLYLLLGLANQFMPDLKPENFNPLYNIAGLFGFASSALTAVGLFQVFGDVAGRLDRSRAGRSPDDDYRRRPRGFDDEGDPRWGQDPSDPNIRR